MSTDKKEVVVMDKEALDDLIYWTCLRATRRANDKQFAGMPFSSIENTLNRLENEIEYIKTVLQVSNSPKSNISQQEKQKLKGICWGVIR